MRSEWCTEHNGKRPYNPNVFFQQMYWTTTCRPSYLQNITLFFRRKVKEFIRLYAFDAPVLGGVDLRSQPLATRREMLRELVSKLPDTIRFSETFDASAAELMAAVRSNGLEGVVAKRRDSSYKPGDRSGAWVKVSANRGQELVIGGNIPGSTTFDSILVGHYEGSDLMYAARVRNGFTPASRRTVFLKFEGVSISICPFRNLPESRKGRWGEGLTAEDIKRCRWLTPKLVAMIEFLE
jgi:ATP-dependent DNA ligase